MPQPKQIEQAAAPCWARFIGLLSYEQCFQLSNIGIGHQMNRKTMRIGGLRTSLALESEFWDYLKTVATQRHLRLFELVNEVAAASPERSNLASTLRIYAMSHARLRTEMVQSETSKLVLAGNTQDLDRILEACPLPALIIDGDRGIRQVNRAFAIWLNVDGQVTIGQRLDTIMILRSRDTLDTWSSLLANRMAWAGINATCISPSRGRTAQVIAVTLSAPSSDPEKRGCVLMFDTAAEPTQPGIKSSTLR